MKTDQPTTLKQRLAPHERSIIVAELDAHDGNVRATAASLGIAERTLWYKLRQFQIRDSAKRAQ